MTVSKTWSLRPGQTLQHRQWDGETVVYNDLSGDTHLLGDAAIVLLQALRDGPATCAALAALLASEFEPDAADDEPLDFEAEADALLEHMKRLFLVDHAAC